MTRLWIATIALFSLIGPMTAGLVMAVADLEHCTMTMDELADEALSTDSDCCLAGCAAPTCCRLTTDLCIVLQIVAAAPVNMHSTDGFQALPDAPRAAHTWGLERPPKV